MERIDHFQATALAIAYELDITVEEAQEILYKETLKRYNEFFNSDSNSVQNT